MRIRTDASERAIEPAINWIGGIIGALVDKRIAGFEQHEKRNPLLATYYEDNYALEFALVKARHYRKKTGRLPKGSQFDPLYGFVIAAQRIHSALPNSTKPAFEGRVRDIVRGNSGARPLAFEVGIATHLMQQWDVEFADMNGAARYDFLARRSSVEIEIECKTTSGDTGRKIHRQTVNRFADMIVPSIAPLADRPGCHLLHVRIPDRLNPSDQELKRVATQTADAILGKATASSSVSVNYRLGEIDSWPDPSTDLQAWEFFRNLIGASNPHLLFYVRPGMSIVILAIESEKPDKVIDAIVKQAKEAADQCSGTRPALITIYLADPIEHQQLKSLLATSNGLHRIAHEIFKSGERNHVDSIVYTVPQTMNYQPGYRRSSGDVLVLFNPTPKFECPEARTIFQAQ